MEKKPLVFNQKGTVMAVVLSVVMILVLLSMGFWMLSLRETSLTNISKQVNQAFHIAEAGLDYGFNQIVETGGIWSGTSGLVSFEQGSFKITVSKTVSASPPYLATYTLTSVGRVADIRKTLTATITQQKTLWNYVVFTNQKTTTSYDFISYKSMGDYYWDETTGTVQANGNNGSTGGYDLYIYSIDNGYPKFNGYVNYVNGYYITLKTPYFNPEADNPRKVVPVTFPTPSYSLLKNKAEKSLSVYSGNVSVKFLAGTTGNGDGQVEIVSSGGTFTETKPLGSRENVLYVVNGNAYVQGTLDGRATVVATGSSYGNVYVVDNVRYAETNLAVSDDMFGLIAENNIEIYEPPDTGIKWGMGTHTSWGGGIDAYGKVYIDAILYAQNGHISYQGYNSIERDILYVNGALIRQKDSAAVSKMGEDMKSKYGYLKRYNFDWRINYIQPPYFFAPDSAKFKITSWAED